MIARLPLSEQLVEFRRVLSQNETLIEVLSRVESMRLPNWYLTAGCLFQTVWNVQTGREPSAGIIDYDVFYFDDRDLSWDAENLAIEAATKVFEGMDAEVEIRNEARVHLWYEEKFGVPLAPLESTEAAIDNFASTTCCLGIRGVEGQPWRIYAPHGLSDVFNLVIRPNPVLAPHAVYQAKTARWKQQWPELEVMPWPCPDAR
ncbi:nucleotidyltransferase family protein [Saxibacter everestensis]|uniref:Nucleotidyltransferase family protein n=1 Tax=Saxibacter everestensis TaxID=2909229 RepID=A0ABY8QVE8_9MICO|nr:nucleotidyltransferase family protein [Brevibacteriaceae bacterium ZFBP1038]